MESKEGAFWEAAQYITYFYHIHPLTRILTEGDVTDWRFWLPMDLFEWRWKSEIEELFPLWEFTHNTDGHYVIEPAEYICPEERWEICKTTLRQPTFHTMYNLPNNSDKITYWDVFVKFSGKHTADEVVSELEKKQVHPDVREFIIQRGCPKDLEEFVWCWAEEERELYKNWQKWGQRGIEDHILKVTENITGVFIEEWEEKNPIPRLRRQATWAGKFYPLSDACHPREKEGNDTLIMVDVVAPWWLHNMCSLEESGPEENPTWKSIGVLAGKSWMIDVIWANLTHAEREEISKMYNLCNEYLHHWLYIQLVHNWEDCFTDESKFNTELSISRNEPFIAPFRETHKWMMIPREVTW